MGKGFKFSMKKVIVHIIIGLNKGGAEATLVKLCLNMKNYNHIVISLTGLNSYSKILKDQKINVYNFSFERHSRFFSNCCKLFLLLKKLKPDVVQTWMYHADLIGGLLARMCKVDKVYWNVRNSQLDLNYTKYSTLLIAKICSYLSNIIPHKIVSCSHAGMLEHIKLGYTRNKFVLISNGYENIDFENVLNRYVSERLSFDKSIVFTIGMAARYDRIKDYDTLILCLVDFKKTNPNFLCFLAGEGVTELNTLLYNKIVDYGLVKNIKLLGLCEDMHKFYASLDVFVMSSFSEGFPNVIGEAMNFGIPCISSNVGDSKLIIADCGWIIPPKNQSKMTESLLFAHKMYLENKDEWVRLKSKCNLRISNIYSNTIMFEKYSNLWN